MTVKKQAGKLSQALSIYGVNNDGKTVVGRSTPGSTVDISTDNFSSILSTVTADSLTGIWTYYFANALTNGTKISTRSSLLSTTTLSSSTAPVVSDPIPTVIYVTDLGQDVDDAAGLALLIVLHKQGLIKLGGVVTPTTTGHATAVARIFLDYAGLTTIPAAGRRGNDVYQADHMNAALTTFYDYPLLNVDYPAPVTVMRTVLANAADNTAIICCVGPMPDIYDLLQSPSDAIDSRNGNDLVKAKCKRVTFQGGGNYSANATTVVVSQDFNWSSRPDLVNPVFQALQNMPMEVWTSDGLWGNVYSGPLLSSPSDSNPLKKAFDFYDQDFSAGIIDTATRRTRASWDVAAALSTLGLKDRFTVVPGFMSFDQPNNNTATWTANVNGNFKYLVPIRSTDSIVADMEALYDAFDQGPTEPNPPTFTVTETYQGSVVLTIDPQFFTTYKVSTDNGQTFSTMPSNNTLTTLTPNTTYQIVVQASRYGLTPVSSSPVSYKTKAVAAVTSIEAIPYVLRHFDTTVKTYLAPNTVSDTVELTSVTDKVNSANTMAPDGSQGLVYIASSTFGTNRGAVRSVNGDVYGGSAAGTYARLFGDLPELANKQDYAMFILVTVNNDRDDNGGILSFCNSDANDYGSAGFVVQVSAADRTQINLYGNNAAGGSFTFNHDTSIMLIGVIVTAGSAQLWLNGSAVGSPINLGTLGSATPHFCIFRRVYDDTGCIFGDLASFVVVGNVPSLQNQQYIEGSMLWSGSEAGGSLLPAGHPYQTVSP